MKEVFEQATQMMESSWKLWQQMLAKSPWVQQPEAAFLDKWNSWISTMRSGYELNTNTWNTFLEQSEETFFKALRQTVSHNQTAETQWREMWNGLKKACATQQELVKNQLDKMEELLSKPE